MSFQYLSHRPNLDPEMPFYLGVNRLNNAKSWYKNQPLGEKTLRFLMQKAVKKSNIEKKQKIDKSLRVKKPLLPDFLMKEYQLHVFNNTQAICLWKVSTIMQITA